MAELNSKHLKDVEGEGKAAGTEVTEYNSMGIPPLCFGSTETYVPSNMLLHSC